MFAVIELQKNNGILSVLHDEFATRQAADQKFHTVLAYAAASQLEMHSATLLNEDGRMIRYESYQHQIEPAAEAEE